MLTSEQRKVEWSIGVDIGGTFTDVVLWRDGADAMRREKLLTTPDDPSKAVVEGIQRALSMRAYPLLILVRWCMVRHWSQTLSSNDEG